jgi:hypothetical protein
VVCPSNLYIFQITSCLLTCRQFFGVYDVIIKKRKEKRKGKRKEKRRERRERGRKEERAGGRFRGGKS